MEPITIKNFWNASVGTWEEINEIPEGFEKFANSGSSTYYTNKEKDTVVRTSDHWGSGIRECNWYLSGFPRNNSFLFSKRYSNHVFTGMIKLTDLVNIEGI